jgi:hypothetical protein
MSSPVVRLRFSPRRFAAVVAAVAATSGIALWPTAPVGAVDYTSTCTIPLAPGAELEATIAVTATGPDTVEEGADGELTDLQVVYSAIVGADPGAVLEAGKLTLTDGSIIALGDSAASPDGNTFTWTLASVPFTAGEPPVMDFTAKHLTFSQGLIGIECPIASSEPFASVAVTAAPTTTTTTAPTSSTTSTTAGGGTGTPGQGPSGNSGTGANPAVPVTGNPSLTG